LDRAALNGAWMLTFPEFGAQQQSLTIESGKAVGNGGCNRFDGALEQSGAALRFTNLQMTEMACDSALMSKEALFFEALEQVRGGRAIGDTLSLIDGDGAVVLQFERRTVRTATIDETTWEWAAGSWNTEPPSLRIEANDAAGFTGCNSWHSNVDRAEDRLGFVGFGQTKMACFGLTGTVEQKFIDNLMRTARYRIDNTILRLFDQRGAEVMRMTARAP
jgi:heat shock protein HslJ